jgi:hypothetical protein
MGYFSDCSLYHVSWVRRHALDILALLIYLRLLWDNGYLNLALDWHLLLIKVIQKFFLFRYLRNLFFSLRLFIVQGLLVDNWNGMFFSLWHLLVVKIVEKLFLARCGCIWNLLVLDSQIKQVCGLFTLLCDEIMPQGFCLCSFCTLFVLNHVLNSCVCNVLSGDRISIHHIKQV